MGACVLEVTSQMEACALEEVSQMLYAHSHELGACVLAMAS